MVRLTTFAKAPVVKKADPTTLSSGLDKSDALRRWVCLSR